MNIKATHTPTNKTVNIISINTLDFNTHIDARAFYVDEEGNIKSDRITEFKVHELLRSN